ncbi:hypothetical protein ACVJBD_002780 [Rhizobium mongolense]
MPPAPVTNSAVSSIVSGPPYPIAALCCATGRARRAEFYGNPAYGDAHAAFNECRLSPEVCCHFPVLQVRKLRRSLGRIYPLARSPSPTVSGQSTI